MYFSSHTVGHHRTYPAQRVRIKAVFHGQTIYKSKSTIAIMMI
jgi:hypothetical protein